MVGAAKHKKAEVPHFWLAAGTSAVNFSSGRKRFGADEESHIKLLAKPNAQENFK